MINFKKVFIYTFAIFFNIAGLIFLFFLAACTPTHNYNVSFDKNVSIYPYSDYTYKTANKFTVIIDQEKFVIPRDFETDLASIPRILWALIPPQYSAFVQPSIVHDYFYRCNNDKSRLYADDIFYYSLISQGVSKWTAAKFYVTVRVFGYFSYSKSIHCNNIKEYSDSSTFKKIYPYSRRLEIASL